MSEVYRAPWEAQRRAQLFLGSEEGKNQEWPGGKEGVRRTVRRRPAGMGVTEGVKEGGDTQICILGKPLGASREQTGGK